MKTLSQRFEGKMELQKLNHIKKGMINYLEAFFFLKRRFIMESASPIR